MVSLPFLAQAMDPYADEFEKFEEMAPALAGVLLVLGLVGLVLFICVWGMIFSRAGYSFAMVLLMFLPIVNVIWLLIFAFSRWPVQRELDAYRASQQGYPPPPLPGR